ncbi:AAA family ATPase [uncultured Methanobrevibacter sp.]|uniref:AAA family ATPase n=1 Tax=uncultured Methanobrevibacter sp. TaxID=253161 RepID=UPI0025F73A71|nr:AAA family ATPase [uncultured Methanobrevibacter sp.]
MIIKSMTIENYRPYKGPVNINFARGEKNVTIIQGRNDAGKTSFINAFTWCLYDKEPFRDEGIEGRCNQLALDKVNVKDEVDVKVEMIFEDSSGREITIIRQQTFIKTSENSNRSKQNSELKIYRNDGLHNEKIENPEGYMKNNLPESLQEYFMFTGEKLTQFFNKDQDFVKNGVYTLYQLDLLENINIQAKKWENYFNAKFRKINPRLSELKNEKSQIIEDQQNDKIQLRQNKERIETLEVEIKTLYEKIGASGADANEIRRDIENLNDEKRSLSYDLKTIKKEYSSLISENFSHVMSYDLLKNLKKWDGFEEESEEEVEISFVVSDLKKLLKNKECVCGASLEEHTDSYQHIQHLIESLESTSKETGPKIEDIISKLLDISENIIARYPNNLSEELGNKKQRIREINHDIESKEIKIEGLETRLKNLDVDAIDELNKQIEENQELIKNLTEDNTILKENLNTYPIMIDDLELLISQAIADEDVKDDIGDKLDFCEEIKLISNKLYDDLAVNIYKTLSEVVTEEYKTIHWKPDYKNIIVDQDFKVLVEKSRGNVVSATDPSTGSRNVLALTFMAALNSLSGFVLPQVIDTPIASLDLEMRSEVAKALPRYMKGKQMILLVMNSEYTGEFKTNIDEFVGYQYKLDYVGSDGEGQTVINEFDD